jgi:hypothetical protein
VRRKALALLAVALLTAGGCGDDDSANSESATRLLERGFASDVDTGVLYLEAELEVEGGPVEGPFRLELDGPFRAAESPTQLPDLDMAFRAAGAGTEYEGRVILTRENAWVEFQGEAYEAGEELWARARDALEEEGRGEPETFADAGVDPLDWVTDLEESGEEDVRGALTTKVTGRLDAERMLRDFGRLPGVQSVPESVLDQVDDVVDDVEFEAWIGEDDIWRRVRGETEFQIPDSERESAGRVEGGTISLQAELEDPGEPVEIHGPAEARPLDELLRRLGIPPEMLLGPGFATPTPG